MNKPIEMMNILELANVLQKYEIDELYEVVAIRLREIHNLTRFKTVDEETPPIHYELLVKAPDGIIHIASWRPAYNIFTCQVKRESTTGWKWKLIDPLKDDEL